MRLATYNTALNRPRPGDLIAELSAAPTGQLKAVLEVLVKLQADVLILNEVDYDPQQRSFHLIRQRLAAMGCAYRYGFSAPVNTGVPSGRDLVNPGGPDNTPFGFGRFPGQYGMMILSRWPIDRPAVRTFQQFLWQDLPDARLPRHRDGQPFYAREDLAVLRLSSKSHWDVPIQLEQATLHLLVSHPTPPAFDGPEGRNRYRNAAEIEFWRLYSQGNWAVTDDQGRTRGFDAAQFVLAGDLNADPNQGDSLPAIRRLLESPWLHDPRPLSEGAQHRWPGETERAANTAIWDLRADYLLPSTGLTVIDSQVVWPLPHHPMAQLLNIASDHRPVTLTLQIP